MYADKITKSMQRTIEETERRREIQIKYNQDHNKKPEALNKKITVINTKAEQFELNPYEQKPLHIVAAEQREKYGKMSEEEKNEKLNRSEERRVGKESRDKRWRENGMKREKQT